MAGSNADGLQLLGMLRNATEMENGNLLQECINSALTFTSQPREECCS